MHPEKKLGEEFSRRLAYAQRAVNTLLELPDHHIQTAILFGSTVRGEARPDSDIDLCISYEGLSSRHILFYGGEQQNHLRSKGFKLGVHLPMGLDLTLIPQTYLEEGQVPEELRKHIADMKNEGIVLYSKSDK